MVERFSLQERIAVVTGAGQGLGQAIAMGMAEAGAKVVLAGRTEATLKNVAALVTQRGGEALMVPTDVAKRNDHEDLVNAALQKWGKIDILVNNAGTNVRKPTAEYPEEDWDTVVGTNLKGTFFLTQLVAQEMIRNQYGKIIHIASLASITGLPNIPAYTAAKGGIGALTYQMAVEWAKDGINVNSICPGYIRTPLTQPIQDSERSDYIEARVPMGRWGQPEDIAGTVVFLASGASDYLTGQLIAVDGGWMAGG